MGQLEGYDGILVPGGFGKRGIDGMLNAIRYARENQVPYFGICLGTMRLGAWPCHLTEGSVAQKSYGAREIGERHRHRYEFNRVYEERLTASGLRITGETPNQTYVEICEIPEHPWMLGCQFHPEFKSKPLEPHPLFKAFIDAAYCYRSQRLAPLARHAEAEPGYFAGAGLQPAGASTAGS